MADAQTTPAAPEPHPVAPNSVAVDSGAGDALAAFVALAGLLETVGGYCPVDSYDAGRYAAMRKVAHELRAAIAETRARLGEVSVREEWGVRQAGAVLVIKASSRESATDWRSEDDALVRRATTTHVTDWIEEKQ